VIFLETFHNLLEYHATIAPSIVDPAPPPVRAAAVSVAGFAAFAAGQRFLNTLMPAEVEAVCGAAYEERGPERVNSRNGYQHREFAVALSHH
jgi:putative transposase